MSLKWDMYDVEIQFLDLVVGGIPQVSVEGRVDAYRGWLKGQDVVDDPAFPQPLVEKLAEDPDMPVTEEPVEQTLTAFKKDDTGLYLESRQVEAMLKEAAQRLGIIKKVRGSRQVLQHDLHVRNPKDRNSMKLYLGVTEPSGIGSRPISVITPQGPRTSIKAFEYVNGQPHLEFRILLLRGGVGDGLIGDEELADMLELSGMLGLGADRSQGAGAFRVLGVNRVEPDA